MQIKDLNEKDYIIVGNEIFCIREKKPTGEAVIEIETRWDWDEPRPDGINEYQKKYGIAYFPMTKLCECLKQGRFRTASNNVIEILTPVTKTYKTPKGWNKLGKGKETVTVWGYPDEHISTWRAYVDEYGIRRKTIAISPNKHERLKILGVVKADLNVRLSDDRRNWVIILPGADVDLYNFLTGKTCETQT